MDKLADSPWWKNVLCNCSVCERDYVAADIYYGGGNMCPECELEYEPTDAELLP